MDAARLVAMANRIGAYFESEPDPEAGRRGVAEHLLLTWPPAMRRLLLEHLDSGRAPPLRAIVAAAVRAHRDRLAGPRSPA